MRYINLRLTFDILPVYLPGVAVTRLEEHRGADLKQWMFVVEVVRVAGSLLHKSVASSHTSLPQPLNHGHASLPQPPSHALTLWKKHLQASFLVRLFDRHHSWYVVVYSVFIFNACDVVESESCSFIHSFTHQWSVHWARLWQSHFTVL